MCKSRSLSLIHIFASPGRFNIDKDKLTLLDALSMAGDLTVYGKTGVILDNRISIRQILPLCDCDEHKVYSVDYRVRVYRAFVWYQFLC